MAAQTAAWSSAAPLGAAHARALRSSSAPANPTTQRTTFASPLLFGLITTLLVLGAVGDAALAQPLAALSLLILVGLALVQPRVALFTLFGLAIFFEPYSADPNMLAGTYLNQDIAAAFALPGLQFTGFEVIQLVALVGILVGSAARGRRLQGGQLFGAAMFFAAMVLFGFTRGIGGGGLVNFAVWEGRFLLGMIVCFIVAANAVRTRAHVVELLSMFLVAVSMSGLEGAWRRAALIDNHLLGEASEAWYGHDNVVFWGSLIMLVVAQQAFGAARWQRVVGPFAGAITVYTLLASERRSGYVSLVAAFLALTIVFLIVKRKAFFLISVPFMIGAAIYLPLFWHATGPLAQPARAIRSISDPDPRDAMSNLARDLEKINIRATIASEPVTGVGFGRPYLLVAQIPDISWFVLWQYATHAQIMWIWLKTGAVGFASFWILMGSALSRAAYNARALRDRDLKVFSILGMLGVVTAVGFCYVDLGLVGARIPIFVGTLLGCLSIVPMLDAAPTRTPARQAR